MKKRLLTFITALFILLLASNCAKVKPLFQASNVPGLTPPHSTHMTHTLSYFDNFSYAPTPAEENGIFSSNKAQYHFTTSFPATVKFEF